MGNASEITTLRVAYNLDFKEYGYWVYINDATKDTYLVYNITDTNKVYVTPVAKENFIRFESPYEPLPDTEKERIWAAILSCHE